MTNLKKALAGFLTLALLCALPTPVSAETAGGTPKEEVVYVNLSADGAVQEINVVNIFELENAGKIVDYGEYESVRNMTTTDEIRRNGDTVTIDAPAGKLYYEGRLKSDAMPWNMEVHYYLDGEEYSADEIAGKSGALKISVTIEKKPDCPGGFFDGYALQVCLTLDTAICRNITAEGATVANVGSSKQITYTVLPGKGADFSVTADVTDFEMDGISVNGIPLNLDIEVDDAALMEQVTALLDAIARLDDGAGAVESGIEQLQGSAQSALQGAVTGLKGGTAQLYAGVAGLKDGGSDLERGSAQLQAGAADLHSGLTSLEQGLGQIQTALDALNSQSPALTQGSAAFRAALGRLQTALGGISITTEDLSALQTASTAIQTGIDKLVAAAATLQQRVSFAAYEAAMGQQGLDVEALRQNNAAAIGGLQATVASLNQQIAALQAAGADVSGLQAQVAQLQNVIALLNANNLNISGMETYLNTVSASLADLLSGATALQTNYAAFHTQIGTLVQTLNGLVYQMSDLSAAVNALVSEYEELDGAIGSYTDAVAQIVSGYTQLCGGTTALVNGSSALQSGTVSLYASMETLLSGIVEVYNGTGSLKDGAGQLDSGVAALLAGIAQLSRGSAEMKGGTAALRGETSDMDSRISGQIDDLLHSVTGGDTQICSFVSSQNTEVRSVQFVIKTAGIHPAQAEPVEEAAPAQSTLWQKFLQLFGVE